jgi:arabinogalactan endo-1,4-beta-galactosidase
LLHSAANGVRAASSSTKIIIHFFAEGWNAPDIKFFYSHIFIPLQSTLQGIVTEYAKVSLCFDCGVVCQLLIKDVMVVETNWPVVCPDVNLSNKSVHTLSAAGQLKWSAGIRDVIEDLPGGHGLGILHWEPGWVGNVGLGLSCAVR